MKKKTLCLFYFLILSRYVDEYNTKEIYRSHSFFRRNLVCTYIGSRQSHTALGRFHHADKESFHRDSGK